MVGLSPSEPQGLNMNDISNVKDQLLFRIFLNYRNIVQKKVIGELATRSAQKYQNTVRHLRYNKQT